MVQNDSTVASGIGHRQLLAAFNPRKHTEETSRKYQRTQRTFLYPAAAWSECCSYHRLYQAPAPAERNVCRSSPCRSSPTC